MIGTTPTRPRARPGIAGAAALALSCVIAACTAGTSPAPSEAASSPPGLPSDAAATSTPETTVEPGPVDGTVAAGLAFVGPMDGVNQVMVIDEDGSARQVSGLDADPAIGAAQPMWSPDRTMIAFGPLLIGSGLDPQLWVVNADGTDQRPIATLGESTDWSPDSTRLVWTDSVFTTDNTGEPARMWLGDAAGRDVIQLGPRGTGTRWLPDGERISFTSADDPERGIIVMRVPDGQPRELVEGVGGWWSPDGESLLVERPDGIYVANADGSGARLLVADVASPEWSPDGSRVAFVDVDESGNFVVGVAAVDGDIVWEGSPGIDPTWSPDGAHLAVDLTIGEPLIGILDAATGERVWQFEGRYPDW